MTETLAVEEAVIVEEKEEREAAAVEREATDLRERGESVSPLPEPILVLWLRVFPKEVSGESSRNTSLRPELRLSSATSWIAARLS